MERNILLLLSAAGDAARNIDCSKHAHSSSDWSWTPDLARMAEAKCCFYVALDRPCLTCTLFLLLLHRTMEIQQQSLTLPTLPLEVHELFIDELHADKAALAACSLVCQSWLHPSRRYLFRTICVELCDRRSQRCRRDVDESTFLDFLQDSRNVCSYIRALNLDAMARSHSRRCVRTRIIVPVELEKVASILSLLPRLATLRVTLLDFNGESSDAGALPQGLFSLKELAISSSDLMLEGTLAFLNMFHSVDRLCMQEGEHSELMPRVPETGGHSFLPTVPTCRVQALDLRGVSSIGAVWLRVLRHSSSNSLLTVTIADRNPKKFEAVDPILRDAGSNIRSLEFYTWDSMTAVEEESLPRLDLSPCSSLQCVTFRLPVSNPEHVHIFHTSPFHFRLLFKTFADLLFHVSRTLERVTFRLELSTLDEKHTAAVHSLDWFTLDRALSGRENLTALSIELLLPCGKTTAISGVVATQKDKLCGALERVLPATWARTLVSVNGRW